MNNAVRAHSGLSSRVRSADTASRGPSPVEQCATVPIERDCTTKASTLLAGDARAAGRCSTRPRRAADDFNNRTQRDHGRAVAPAQAAADMIVHPGSRGTTVGPSRMRVVKVPPLAWDDRRELAYHGRLRLQSTIAEVALQAKSRALAAVVRGPETLWTVTSGLGGNPWPVPSRCVGDVEAARLVLARRPTTTYERSRP